MRYDQIDVPDYVQAIRNAERQFGPIMFGHQICPETGLRRYELALFDQSEPRLKELGARYLKEWRAGNYRRAISPLNVCLRG